MSVAHINKGYEHTRLGKYYHAVKTDNLKQYHKRKENKYPPTWESRMRILKEWAIQNQIEKGDEWSFTLYDAMDYMKSKFVHCTDRLDLSAHIRHCGKFIKVGKSRSSRLKAYHKIDNYRAMP